MASRYEGTGKAEPSVKNSLLRTSRVLLVALFRATRVLLVVGCAVILTSIGGAAIYASPVTLPLLLLVAMNSPERRWRIAAAVVGGLTALEAVWAVAWQLWPQVGSFAIGALAGVVCTVGMLKSRALIVEP